jgi:DNA polymerase III alpha subunit
MNKVQALTIIDCVLESARTDTHKDNLILIPALPGFSKKELAQLEYECIGFYLSNNPLLEYKQKLNQLCSSFKLKDKVPKERVIMGGRIAMYRPIKTKMGMDMAFLSVEDLTGRFEVVIFSDSFTRYNSLLFENSFIEIEGNVEAHQGFKDSEGKHNKLIARAIRSLEEVKKLKKISIEIDNNYEDLHIELQRYTGNVSIDLLYNKIFIVPIDNKISYEHLTELEKKFYVKSVYE